MAARTPAQRSLQARAAAYRSWANTPDSTARTQPGRDKFSERFDDEVDPDRLLPEAERARRAEYARRAYFASLSLRGVQARREKAQGRARSGRSS